jgi:SAM-dependent methyltransferase
MEMAELPTEFLERLRDLQTSYLRETDPVRQSGFGGGDVRWRMERELILDAVSGDGDFLDVGCANGYLLECLVKWGHERHIRLTPYGLDYGDELIALAKNRLPEYGTHFWVGNSWEWIPPRAFRYVYSLYDCVPEELLPAYVRRLARHYVADGGTLILGAYGSLRKQEAARDITVDITAAGFRVAGSSRRGELPTSRVAWTRAEQAARAGDARRHVACGGKRRAAQPHRSADNHRGNEL